MLTSFKNGRYRTVDAALIFVTNGSMRKLAGRLLGERHTTDVLSFRYIEPETGVKNNRDDDARTPWDLMFTSTITGQKNDSETVTTATSADNGLTGNVADASETFLSNDLGAVIIAPDYCSRVAKRRGIAAPHYLLMAVTHGLAHLSGHDHETDAEYMEMKAAEEKALQKIRDHAAINSYIHDMHSLPKSYLK